MLDIKEWLKPLNLPVADTAFKSFVLLPFIIFTEDRDSKGSDFDNNLFERNISIEFYSDKIFKSKEDEIEKLLDKNLIHYRKNRVWVDDERCYETIYDFIILERKE